MRVTVSGGRCPSTSLTEAAPWFDADNVVGQVTEHENGTLRLRLDDKLHADMWIELVIDIRGRAEEVLGGKVER